MTLYNTLACTLVTLSLFACTQPSVEVTPVNPIAQARGGGSSTPTSPAPVTLPTLTPNPSPLNDLRPVMPVGTWTIKSGYRSGADVTSEFKGCTFVFSADGVVVATDAKGKSTSGGWFTTVGGVTYYGSAPTVTSLSIIFDKKAPKPFDRLSNSWNVNLATTTTSVVLDNFEPLAGERLEFGQ